MYTQYRVLCVIAAAGIMGAACSRSNPVRPTEQSAPRSGAEALTASVGAPRPSTPANGAQIRNVDQPVTIVAANGFSTKSGATYTFEVATDSAFTTKVQTKDVPEASGGQTSLKLDALAAAKDYYWHVRSTSAGTTGVFSATFKFTVGPAVTIGTPAPIAPLNGAATGARPAFRVTNATRQGPAGAITYRFEISTNSAFTAIVASGTVAEGVAETGFIPSADLPVQTTLYWRATAIDSTNAMSSAPSATQSFATSKAIDLSKVVYLKGPDLSTWRETGRIVEIYQDGNALLGGPMCIRFTDPGWPGAKWIYGGEDPNFEIFANQWYFANINGVWYGGPGEWIYRGAATCKAGQGTKTIGPDSGFGNPFASWVPKPGELVGYGVSASARALPQMATVQERTDVVLMPWYDSSLQAVQPFHGQLAIEFSR